MSTLSFDILVKLSADEFAHLVANNTTLSDKDILLMITRFENDVLEKIKHKDGEQHERYLFYKRVLHIMYMALQAEEQINFWKNVAIRSKMEAEFNRENATIYYAELMKYKTIEQVVNDGNLDKYITEVKQRNQQK